MAKVSFRNVSHSAPKWFLKLKKAVSLSSNTIIVFLLALGYSDQSLAMLIVKVGASYVVQLIEVLLKEPDETTEQI